MAPSRRQIAGRSPLVNQQRQITAFFGKSAASSSPTPSPSPSLSNKKTPKSNPNPNSPSPSPPKKTHKSNSTNPRSDPPARSPSPGPATPSPVQSKLKKPLLVIGQTPSPPKSAEITYGDEVVGKQVRVYWPMDKRWYDGSVTSYDKSEGKHVVEYDDGEEESLDLGKEKIEWVVGAKSGVRFKRLRRGASAFRRVVTDDDEDVEMSNVEEGKEDKSDGDDSNDEDWGKNMGKEVCESEEDDENEVDEEEMVEEKDEETPKVNRVSKTDSRKRKTSEVAKSGSEKKSRTDKETTLKGFKAPGDVVEFSGIFLPIPYTGFKALRAGLVASSPDLFSC